MRISCGFSRLRGIVPALAVGFGMVSSLIGTGSAVAQQPQARIAAIDSSARATLVGSRPAAARSATDTGRMSAVGEAGGRDGGVRPVAEQEAALQALLKAQQTPGSPQYHKWLTPDQFGAQFGMADADIAKVEGWLQQQGFSVTGVSRSRNRITFSGSVGQIEAAFGTEMHTYKAGTESHFAPSSDLSVPAALAGKRADGVESVGLPAAFACAGGTGAGGAWELYLGADGRPLFDAEGCRYDLRHHACL